jgi:hypothetical protein
MDRRYCRERHAALRREARYLLLAVERSRTQIAANRIWRLLAAAATAILTNPKSRHRVPEGVLVLTKTLSNGLHHEYSLAVTPMSGCFYGENVSGKSPREFSCGGQDPNGGAPMLAALTDQARILWPAPA